MLTDLELTQYVDQLSHLKFGQSFRHNAVWNIRLRTTGGRFFPKDGHLDFNPKFADHESLDKIILHELCHYHLYYAHAGYKHEDKDFKMLLKKVGGSRHAPSLSSKKIHYLYMCESCGRSYPRQRKIDTLKYRCGKCRGKLKAIKNAS
ncbi:SprT family protein [Lactovum miscens]|uniref:SprT-like protein n=1 Tax=Lactovum miscens TaxID=190387 RepID=A0A841C245_9LACT|nr:SprT-like protein [Lactovum miscens]